MNIMIELNNIIGCKNHAMLDKSLFGNTPDLISSTLLYPRESLPGLLKINMLKTGVILDFPQLE